MSDVTQILAAVRAGDAQAAHRLFEVVYSELRRLASGRMAGESPGHTLQPTALVHEAWLRLGGAEQPPWESRAHFFAAAAEAMRRILVDRARRKLARRRGARAEHVDLEGLEIAMPADEDRLLAVHEALDRFAALNPEKAELVKLRYFVGLSLEQAAEALNISEPTAKRWWTYAKAWLFQALKPGDAG